MRKTAITFLLALGLIAPAAFAQSIYSDFYVIPVASHTPGVNNTLWMSDVSIRNISNAPLSVQLVFIESGEGNSDNVFPIVTPNLNGSATVPPNGSVMLRDVLNGYRGQQSASGSILIGADQPFAITSRSYVTREDGGTIGQTVQPVRDFIENVTGRTNNDAVAYLPGLINNAQYRTNIGFVAGNGSSSLSNLVITVTLRDAAGVVIATRPFFLPAGTFTHVQFSSRLVADQAFDLASAEVKIALGNGVVVPYASVVDNKTADAVFVLAQFPANSQQGKSGFAPSLLRSLFDNTKVFAPVSTTLHHSHR